jgi:hypothetical protein
MFRLDYLSCFLTVLATILVGRKSWTGLLISIVNSLVVCIIAVRTSQFGFIPANLFCVCIYAFSIRSWLRAQRERNQVPSPVEVRSRIAIRWEQPEHTGYAASEKPLELPITSGIPA